MMKSLSTVIASAILASGLAIAAAPAQAGPVLDAIKKKAYDARGIAREGSVLLKHKLKLKADRARGIAREGSVVLKCKAMSALKMKC